MCTENKGICLRQHNRPERGSSRWGTEHVQSAPNAHTATSFISLANPQSPSNICVSLMRKVQLKENMLRCCFKSVKFCALCKKIKPEYDHLECFSWSDPELVSYKVLLVQQVWKSTWSLVWTKQKNSRVLLRMRGGRPKGGHAVSSKCLEDKNSHRQCEPEEAETTEVWKHLLGKGGGVESFSSFFTEDSRGWAAFLLLACLGPGPNPFWTIAPSKKQLVEECRIFQLA